MKVCVVSGKLQLDIAIGTKVSLRFDGDFIVGRVHAVDGGKITLITPHGSIIESGLAYLSFDLTDDELERLKMLDKKASEVKP